MVGVVRKAMLEHLILRPLRVLISAWPSRSHMRQKRIFAHWMRRRKLILVDLCLYPTGPRQDVLVPLVWKRRAL